MANEGKKVKAYLIVTAGVTPGIGLAEFTKRWDWCPGFAEGGVIRMTPEELLKFHELSDEAHAYAKRLSDEAHAYAKNLQNPGYCRWVNLEWRWLDEFEGVML